MHHTLEPGDGLHRSKGMFEHAGTYLGDGRVIHLTPGGIKVERLDQFSDGKHVRVRKNPVPLSVLEERIRKAKTLFPAYGAFQRNCEQFANYIQTGFAHSPQARGGVIGCTLGVGIARSVDADPVTTACLVLGMGWLGVQLARP